MALYELTNLKLAPAGLKLDLSLLFPKAYMRFGLIFEYFDFDWFRSAFKISAESPLQLFGIEDESKIKPDKYNFLR